MIVLEHKRTFATFGILTAGLIPFFFLTMPQAPISLALWPPVIAAEFLIYSLFVMLSAPDAGWGGAGRLALILTFSRFLLCAGGAVLLSLSPSHQLADSFKLLYASNPLSILLQVLVILTLTPHLLYQLFPAFLSADLLHSMREDRPVSSEFERPVGALPTGGYVQVYSYDELTDFLKKIVGIEGFLFYSDEGLPLISHFPFAVNQESAAVASNLMLKQSQIWANHLQIHQMDRFIVETSERYIVNASVLPRVRFVAFFTRSTPIDIVLNRVELIRRSAAEFMKSRVASRKPSAVSTKD